MKNLSGYLKRYAMESVLAPLFKLLEVILDLMVPLSELSAEASGGGTGRAAF